MKLQSIAAACSNQLLSLASPSASAWGLTGHRAVGAFADQLLSSAA